MCPVPMRGLLGTALGLILPLLAAGAARAQAPGWVDPPARSAQETRSAPAKAAPEKAEPAPAQPAASNPPAPAAQAAEKAAPGEARPERSAEAGPGARVRSRRAERPRRRAVRRLADTPAALTIAPRIPAGQGEPRRPAPREGADPRFSDWAGRAQELADDYLAAVSGPSAAMVSGAPRFYGERLRFHGRMTTLAELIAEKRRFAQRWPERSYEPRGSQTACNAALQSCVVRTLVDFRADSPARGARSQGLAELVLEVSFAGGRPVIISESSRVLRRGATVGALAGAGAAG